MAAPVLQFKRGLIANLPALKAGEPGFTTDGFDLFIGLDNNSANNKFFGSHRYWTKETSSTGSSVKVVEGTTNGTNSISLKSPDNLAGDLTYTLPGIQGSVSSVLTNDGSGNLSWASGSANPVFTGIATFNTNQVDVNSTVTISGITTFESTVQSTDKDTGALVVEGGVGVEKNVNIGGLLAVTGVSTFTDAVKVSSTTESTDKDTGALVVEGGVGVEKNLSVGGATTITGNLFVGGQSEFIGVVTFRGGTISLGDANTDDVVVGGEFASDLIPTTDDAFSLGSSSKQWKDLYVNGTADIDALTISGVSTFVGVSTFQSNVFIDGSLSVGGVNITGGTSLGADLSTRNISATGIATITQNLDVNGGADISGGETVLSSATVSDLTSGRVILAGASGSLTDDASLTFSDATGLVVGNSGINVTGVSTFSTDLVVGGDVRVNGNDIKASDGTTALTLSATTGNVKTGGDLIAGSGFLASANGTRGLFIFDTTGNVSFQGKAVVNDIRSSSNSNNTITLADIDATFARNVSIAGITTVTGEFITGGDITVGGNDIKASDGNTNITLTSNTLTTFAGDIRVNGNDIQASDGNTNITLTSNTLTTFAGDIKVGGNDIQASDGTTAITLSATTGNVGLSSDLTINGNLFVKGSTTEVNTETLKVEDSLIEVGLINSGGSLVAPTSDLNIDVGVIFHYFTSSAKKAGVYWDDSVSRVVVSSDLSESSSVITSSTYAGFEIGSLWVNDCAGQSQVISCTGAERFLENITVDGGSF